MSSNTFWINHYQRLCFHLNADIRPDWPVAASCVQLNADIRPDWPVAALCVQLVNSFVCYQTYEDDILKMTQLILMEIGTSGPRARTWNDQLWHSGGQKVKVTQYQNQLQKSLFDEISQELSDELQLNLADTHYGKCPLCHKLHAKGKGRDHRRDGIE